MIGWRGCGRLQTAENLVFIFTTNLSFVFDSHTNTRSGACLLYETEPLSGAAAMVARLWLYSFIHILSTTRISHFLQEGCCLWPAHHVPEGVDCYWQTRGQIKKCEWNQDGWNRVNMRLVLRWSPSLLNLFAFYPGWWAGGELWLHANPRFLESGGGIVRRRVENLKELENQYQVPRWTFPNDPNILQVVVNCSGIGARQLVGDNLVSPLRGQVGKAPLALKWHPGDEGVSTLATKGGVGRQGWRQLRDPKPRQCCGRWNTSGWWLG